MTTFSHSRIEIFNTCPYKYKLSYIDNLDTLPTDEANNALVVGSAMHLGIEQGVDVGIEFYKSQYNILSDEHYNEIIKLETLIPKVEPFINRTKATFEYKIETKDFKGFIDYLEIDENNSVKIYDFKYSNAIDRYLLSDQLHVYKYFYEKLYPWHHVDELGFIMIPKISILQQKNESIINFRKRIATELAKTEVRYVKVDYDPNRVIKFFETVKRVIEASKFPKNENFCRFCNFANYCKNGFDYDLISKN